MSMLIVRENPVKISHRTPYEVIYSGEKKLGALNDQNVAMLAHKLGMTTDKRERVYAIYVKKKKIIGYRLAGVGSPSCSPFDLSMMLAPAIVYEADGICMIHNHPGGRVDHSPEDISCSNLVAKACDIIGIKFIHNYIVTISRINRDLGVSISVIDPPIKTKSIPFEGISVISSEQDYHKKLYFNSIRAVIEDLTAGGTEGEPYGKYAAIQYMMSSAGLVTGVFLHDKFPSPGEEYKFIRPQIALHSPYVIIAVQYDDKFPIDTFTIIIYPHYAEIFKRLFAVTLSDIVLFNKNTKKAISIEAVIKAAGRL